MTQRVLVAEALGVTTGVRPAAAVREGRPGTSALKCGLAETAGAATDLRPYERRTTQVGERDWENATVANRP
ncbi:hypothetical protein STSO111631_01105 [Stackebrandtia soli]